MNSSNRLLALSVIFGIVAVWICVSVEADEVDYSGLDLTDCKKIMARIAKKTLKAFGNCTKELRTNLTAAGAPTDEFEKKLGCAVRCTLFRLDLLEDDGRVTKEKIQKFMDIMVPQDAHEFGHALSEHCNEEFGTKLDMSQEYCESYNEYAQCMQSTLADFVDKTSCHPLPAGG